MERIAQRRRAAATALLLLPAVLFLYWSATRLIRVFHWAERHVSRDSPWDMFYFFLLSLPFHTGLPIPIVHQAWAVAIGCFFRWRAYPILFASLSIGVPMPFVIGRRLSQSWGGDAATAEARLLKLAPMAMGYMTPLRRAIADRPMRSSFLLMWAPLPTSFLPLLIGFIIPQHALSLRRFICGALPSKLLHFSCDVLIGIEAGSLAAGLEVHDSMGVDGPPGSRRHGRLIATGTLLLTVMFMGAMGYAMHQALREMRVREALHNSESVLSAV